ncbi:MAG: hypothetical protein ACRYFE_01770 [Janthinobacterium lividum]|uniref:hypothetical protein n=1 Tax=unclassified Brevundimonas TaxID=2622653 RepID=UPI0025B979E8|nr:MULTISPECIES: hypothetical protein [unclassified Brevundimonas]
MKSFALTFLLAGSALALSACQSQPQAPLDEGVCYHVGKDDTQEHGIRYNVVARDQPQIEFCAARLEELRIKFLRMGGSNNELVGAYQGQYIFIDRFGVKFGKTLDGQRFFALARTGDGRLAIPGAIQRQIDGQPIAVAPN